MNDTAIHPTVSVIIPVYNGERYLHYALESVFAQTYPVYEVIVVDDGSTDGTVEVARRWPGVRVLTQSHGGASMARNYGLSVAQGDVIAYIDADDLWLPEKLARQVEVLNTCSEVGYVLCRMRIFCEEGVEMPETLNAQHHASDPPAVIPSALVVRRSVVDAVGLFDTGLETGEDTDWFARAGDMEIPSRTLDEVLLERRIHGLNNSLICPTNNANLLEVLKRSIIRKKLKAMRKDGGN